jgi:hypothetical protein
MTLAAAAISALSATLSAASLLFSILAFFVGRRLTEYAAVETVNELAFADWLVWGVDVALGVVVPLLIAFILWPVVHTSHAYGAHWRSVGDTLANLYVLVWIGFFLLAILSLVVLIRHVRRAP